MNKLTELLNRWAELEPERCAYCRNDLIFKHNQGDEVWTGYRDSTAHLVQIAVQQAIEARGDIEIEIHYMNRRGGWWYVIVKSDDRRRKRKTDDKLLSVAFLAAYLKALEATAELAA